MQKLTVVLAMSPMFAIFLNTIATILPSWMQASCNPCMECPLLIGHLCFNKNIASCRLASLCHHFVPMQGAAKVRSRSVQPRHEKKLGRRKNKWCDVLWENWGQKAQNLSGNRSPKKWSSMAKGGHCALQKQKQSRNHCNCTKLCSDRLMPPLSMHELTTKKHGVFVRLRFVWICSVALSASFKGQASGLGQLAQNDWRSLTQKRCPFHKDAGPCGRNQHAAKWQFLVCISTAMAPQYVQRTQSCKTLKQTIPAIPFSRLPGKPPSVGTGTT